MYIHPDKCRRTAERETVLKGAQLTFQGCVVDCVVLNISLKGARVRTAAVVPVPERLTLTVRGGAMLPAVRRWARGAEIGLAFSGSPSLDEEHALKAQAAYAILFSGGLHSAIRHLRGFNFFDDPELRHVAEQAEAAHARFEAVLKARSKPT